MHSRISIIFLVLLCGAIAFAGCTSHFTCFPNTGTRDGNRDPTGSASPAMTFTTVPTDAIPAYNQVTIDVGEKDYLGIIPVIFQGGLGQIHVKNIDVKLTRIDGTVQTASLGIKKGDEVDLQGTGDPDP